MDYSELPTHLNCSHLGVYSPVRLRFEGGNTIGGYCVEQYTASPPHLHFYGEMAEARRLFLHAVKCLPSLIDKLLDGGSTDRVHSTNRCWFQFEYRNDYRVVIYCGPHGVSLTANGLTERSKSAVRSELREAHARLDAIYGRFYNI